MKFLSPWPYVTSRKGLPGTVLLLSASFFLMACSREVPPTEMSAKARAREHLRQLLPRASETFLAIMPHLDLGGEVLLYLDLEDFLVNAARAFDEGEGPLSPITPWPEEIPFSAEAFIGHLALDGLQGLGLSSRRDGDLYANRFFCYLPGGRQGIWRFFGETTVSLRSPRIVPADTLILAEAHFAPEYLWRSLTNALESVWGSGYAEVLAELTDGSGVSLPVGLSSWLEAIPARSLFYLRDHIEGSSFTPTEDIWSAFPFLLLLSDAAPAMQNLFLDDWLERGEVVRFPDKEFLIYTFASDLGPLPVFFILHQDDFIITNDIEELRRFRSGIYQRRSLVNEPEFREVRERLPENVKSFYFISPHLGARVERMVMSGSRNLVSIDERPGNFGRWFPFNLLHDLPQDRAIFGAHVNYPDGIAFLSLHPHSFRASFLQTFLLTKSLTARLATAHLEESEHPADRFIRDRIRDQLGILFQAAQIYFMETGEDYVTYAELLRDQGNLLQIESLLGENYEILFITADDEFILIPLPDGTIVEYP